MARDIANEEIRDTAKYTFSIQNDGNSTFQYVNNLDEEVTITAEATYSADTDFSDAYELGSHTVPAGDVERASLSNSWDKIRIIVQATASPSSGVFIGKKH